MPQVSLYVDKKTLTKVEQLAKRHHLSISKWVGEQLKKIIREEYPDNFFVLFGALKHENLKRPQTLPMSLDSKRESLSKFPTYK